MCGFRVWGGIAVSGRRIAVGGRRGVVRGRGIVVYLIINRLCNGGLCFTTALRHFQQQAERTEASAPRTGYEQAGHYEDNGQDDDAKACRV